MSTNAPRLRRGEAQHIGIQGLGAIGQGTDNHHLILQGRGARDMMSSCPPRTDMYVGAVCRATPVCQSSYVHPSSQVLQGTGRGRELRMDPCLQETCLGGRLQAEEADIRVGACDGHRAATTHRCSGECVLHKHEGNVSHSEVGPWPCYQHGQVGRKLMSMQVHANAV